MSTPFYEQPILNSPYEEPGQHHALDKNGQPLDEPPRQGRRRSEFITPVPRHRRNRQNSAESQSSMDFSSDDGISDDDQEYNPTPIINEIRSHVKSWRELPNPNDWMVTPITARLLKYWRSHEFQGIRPFFCQVEAVETIIWLTEVAPKLSQIKTKKKEANEYKKYWGHIKGANAQANPELVRLAMKMATGAGKTTVMAMLIAWQTLNAIRMPENKSYSRGFLIIAPGITIRDRLRVLLPNDAESYYQTRELLPPDLLPDIQRAKIVITNYHAFQLRDVIKVNKVSESALQGRGEKIKKKESEGKMVERVARELSSIKNIVVINDEAHHCYREKPDNQDLDDLKGDDKKEAKAQNEAARLWISGIEAFKRKLGVCAVYDLSATPFFLRGSGYREGTLFPWSVSDFSLIDAIECGIVKLPRVPVADNIPDEEVPVFRELWEHIKGDMPKKGRSKGSADLDPERLPSKLQTALVALYNHYYETDKEWKKRGIEIPPVFIVVCNNTSSSKLVYEWISGYERPNEDGLLTFRKNGNLGLFRNFDEHGNKLAKPNTLLIDSQQIESGDALDNEFKKAAAPEIEVFKRELAEREGAAATKDVSDTDLLREVMNTVGKKGKLGEHIRCVVSVSMLTEGWDVNTVTHILGVRAFGTQLLCEQVVGRGLRRLSYELDSNDRFTEEYSDIMGIPFNFAAKPQVAKIKPPKKSTRVQAVKEREHLEIIFPRLTGYRVDVPQMKLEANFTPDSVLNLTPEMVGPGQTLLEGIVGKGVTISAAEMKDKRPSTIAMELTYEVLKRHFSDENGEWDINMFSRVRPVVRQWLDGGYLVCKGDTGAWMLQYQDVADQAAERIFNAIAGAVGNEEVIHAVLDPYNPLGTTRHVGFQSSKELYDTSPEKCHINHVVCDSSWEAEFARVAEKHSQVISYVKNQGLGFEIPYKDGSIQRVYLPDFIVRIDDGSGSVDPLNLIVEIKGYRNENVKLKNETIRNQWIPAVNASRKYGRWAFAEFTDVYEIDNEFSKLINKVISDNSKQQQAGEA